MVPTMKSEPPSPSPLLTKADAAKLLHICVRSVEHLITSRSIAVIRIGRSVRIERSELERFKKSLTVQAIG